MKTRAVTSSEGGGRPEGLFLGGGGEVFFSDFKLPKSDGAVVALDEDVVFGGKALALGRAGGAVDGDIFLDQFSVEVDGEEAWLLEELAFRVEAGSSEFDDECLPLAGGVGCVDFGGMSFEALGCAFVVPAVVDCSHVAIGGLRLAVAVEDLNLVASLEVDAGV